MDTKKFGDMIIERNIRSMPHHACGICGAYTMYYFYINYEEKMLNVQYDSSCDCGCSTPRFIPLSDPAAHYDNLTDEEKQMMN